MASGSTRILLTSLVTLAVATTTLFSQEASPNKEEAKPASVKTAGQVLDNESLHTLLVNMGLDPKVGKNTNGNNSHAVRIEEGDWDIHVDISLSQNMANVWFTAALVDIPDVDRLPASYFRGLLEKNKHIGPAHFAYVPKSKRMNLYMPVKNRDVTPTLIYKELTYFARTVRETHPTWDISKATPEPKPAPTPGQ
jgi:hypothetical protein